MRSANRDPSYLRRRVITLLVCVVVSVLGIATAASALVVPVNGLRYGVQPHATNAEKFSALPPTPLQYAGGPVVHSNSIYAIYWDPAKLRTGESGRTNKYHGDWQTLINHFFEGFAEESGGLASVLSLTPQYTEGGGARAAYSTTFSGAKVDTTTYPGDGCTDPDHALNKNFACLTDEQLRTELKSYIAANKLATGLGTIYYLLTPPGVTICTDAGTKTGHCSDSAKLNPWAGSGVTAEEQTSYEQSFCSYHSWTTTSGEPMLYAVIPWVAGTFGANLEPANKSGSDCQDGSTAMEEPNQIGFGPDGYADHGLPDVLINQISEEQVATLTDPELNGWYEPVSGAEAPDQCRNWFEAPPVVRGSSTSLEHTKAGTEYNQLIAGSPYYLNTEYNQAAAYSEYPGIPCTLGNELNPQVNSPIRANAGEVVGFDGAESSVTLGQSAQPTPTSAPLYRATFTWSFGDGTSVSGPAFHPESPGEPMYASVFHTYQYGGVHHLQLTIQDGGGNVATTSREITIAGPEAPPAGGGGGSGSGSAATPSAAAAAGTTSPAGATTPAVTPGSATPKPKVTATQAVVSSSLSTTLRNGLVIRYSVSEQVAGRFEVLLASSLARRVGLHGPAATGLAPGTPSQTVIAKAILVTTKGGHSTYKIKFDKATAARLRKLRKVTLMIRLVVRNASSPVATTVLNTVNLH